MGRVALGPMVFVMLLGTACAQRDRRAPTDGGPRGDAGGPIDSGMGDATPMDAPVDPDGGTRDAAAVCGADFPTFDRACTTAADCVWELHQVDCCGSMAALGLNASERDGFLAAEAICLPAWPGCGCASSETVLDDGNSTYQVSEIAVECLESECRTVWLPPGT